MHVISVGACLACARFGFENQLIFQGRTKARPYTMRLESAQQDSRLNMQFGFSAHPNLVRTELGGVLFRGRNATFRPDHRTIKAPSASTMHSIG